jgi:hypothetical protein
MNLVLEPEAYAYVRDAAGYSDFTASVSAVELMYAWAGDFAANPTFYALREGFEALPRALPPRPRVPSSTSATGYAR